MALRRRTKTLLVCSYEPSHPSCPLMGHHSHPCRLFVSAVPPKSLCFYITVIGKRLRRKRLPRSDVWRMRLKWLHIQMTVPFRHRGESVDAERGGDPKGKKIALLIRFSSFFLFIPPTPPKKWPKQIPARIFAPTGDPEPQHPFRPRFLGRSREYGLHLSARREIGSGSGGVSRRNVRGCHVGGG